MNLDTLKRSQVPSRIETKLIFAFFYVIKHNSLYIEKRKILNKNGKGLKVQNAKFKEMGGVRSIAMI